MELLFHRVYEVAELVAERVTSECDPFQELDWALPNISACLNNFSKTSLLGHYCFTHLALNERRRFRKDPETVDIETEAGAFLRYAIDCKPFKEFLRCNFPQGQDEQDAFYPWMLDQEEAFERLWERMTDEVSHLLFGNRGFLLKFNLELAEFRKRRGDSPSLRCSTPQWVKKAVYFRENGKCALCKKDLSGLIALDTKQHYDHIVSLNALGPNDPCNIQLLCEKCNLLKGAAPARTSFVYDPWWK
jgi:HNH endonuclease